MNQLLLTIYRITVSPLLIFALPFLSLSQGKIRRGLDLRRRPPPALPSSEPPIWIHAASGEFEYAKAVIRDLKLKTPKTPILVTYFSPTYVRNIETFPDVDAVCALPLDLPGPCISFLKRYRPKALLIARTDLWPEMMEQCRRRKVPIHLFSYTQKSKLSGAAKVIARWRLSWIDKIYCVSSEDLKNVLSFSPHSNVAALGDTRYDQVRYRLDHPKSLPEALKPSREIPCLVAGSTWPEDEKVLIAGLKPHLSNGKLKLILVPHEPTESHLTELKARLSGEGLTYSMYSSEQNWMDRDVLLVDQLGVLAELYLWADLAFIGGSFRKTVHSVMEALGAECFTIVGPKHTNNREATEFTGKGVTVVNSADELTQTVGDLLAHRDRIQDVQLKLKKEFEARLGASRKLLQHLNL